MDSGFPRHLPLGPVLTIIIGLAGVSVVSLLAAGAWLLWVILVRMACS